MKRGLQLGLSATKPPPYSYTASPPIEPPRHLLQLLHTLLHLSSVLLYLSASLIQFISSSAVLCHPPLSRLFLLPRQDRSLLCLPTSATTVPHCPSGTGHCFIILWHHTPIHWHHRNHVSILLRSAASSAVILVAFVWIVA